MTCPLYKKSEEQSRLGSCDSKKYKAQITNQVYEKILCLSKYSFTQCAHFYEDLDKEPNKSSFRRILKECLGILKKRTKAGMKILPWV